MMMPAPPDAAAIKVLAVLAVLGATWLSL